VFTQVKMLTGERSMAPLDHYETFLTGHPGTT